MRRFWDTHRDFVKWAVLVAVAFGLSFAVTGEITLGLVFMIGYEAAARHALARRVNQLERERRR